MTYALARTASIAFVALALVSACSRQATSDNPAPAQSLTLPQQNVRAYIDPATGQLRDPTPEEIAAEAAEQAARKKSTAVPAERSASREVILPDGTIEIALDQSTQQPLQGCLQPNGELKMEHECLPQADKPRSDERR